jgi:hypothetical protein
MAEEFLKKVYDRYLGSDYEFGDSDLNPKREISKTNLEELESEEDAIMEKIANRLRELHAMATSLPKYKVPEKIDNDDFKTESSGAGLGPDPNPEVNANELAMKLSFGGDPTDSHLLLPGGGLDTQVDFLVGELEGILINVLAVSPPQPGPGPFPGGGGDLTQLYNPGCDDFDGDEEFDDQSNLLDDLKKGINASLNSDENSDDDETVKKKSAAEAADDSAGETNANRDAAAAEREKEVIECITKELPILSAILAILKVVNILKKVLLLILTIVVPIVKMITFAAQCWINPPAAGQVIQMVAEKIAALLITAIGEILQMLWNMLELDCKTEQVQSILDQINEILSGISSSISSTKSAVISFANQGQALGKELADAFDKDKFEQGAENWKNAIKSWAEEDSWNQGKEALNQKLFGGEGVTGAGLQNLMSKALPQDIKSKINNVLNSTKKVVDNTKNAVKEVDTEDKTGVQQKLNDLASFLGPFSVK